MSAECQMPDCADPEDNDLALEERSENISAARDHAFDLGADAYSADGECDALAARYFDHPTLQADFKAGWDTAELDEKRFQEQGS